LSSFGGATSFHRTLSTRTRRYRQDASERCNEIAFAPVSAARARGIVDGRAKSGPQRVYRATIALSPSKPSRISTAPSKRKMRVAKLAAILATTCVACRPHSKQCEVNPKVRRI
jgi:hypothetical protein